MNATEEGTAMKSILCDFTGTVRVKGRSRYAEASWQGGEWTTVDGVLVEKSSVFSEVGSGMVSDVLHGRNACCFTYGEERRGQTEVMGGAESSPGLMANVTDSLLSHVTKINSTGKDKAFLQLSLFALSDETAEITDLLNASPETQNIGNYSVWQDPLRGPVVPDVSSLVLQSTSQFSDVTQFSSASALFAATLSLAPPCSHTIYHATLFKATKTDEDEIEHQISNIRLVLLSQKQATGTGFCGVRRIVDGLLSAQLDPSLVESLRTLVKANVLTYLLCECLGGNCVTTSLGFLGDDASVSDAVLKFAKDARNLKGIVQSNTSKHEVVVTEISRQIASAEERLKQAEEEDGASTGSAKDEGAVSTPNWASSIALRRSAIMLLTRLKACCMSDGTLSKADLSLAVLDKGVAKGEGRRKGGPRSYLHSSPPPSPVQKGEREKGGVGSVGEDGAAGAGREVAEAVATANALRHENRALLNRITALEARKEPAQPMTNLYGTVQRMGSRDSLASSAREGGRIAELEKEVTFLTSKLREERLERVRLQETVAELKGKERTSEDRMNETWREVRTERDKLREEMQKKKLAMQHVIHEKSDRIQQRMEGMEVENAALYEERRVLFKILQDGKRQYERLKREAAKATVSGGVWRPTGGGTSSAAKALAQPSNTNHPHSATHSAARRGRDTPRNGAAASLTHTTPSPHPRTRSSSNHRSSSRQKPHSSTHAGPPQGDERYEQWYQQKVAKKGARKVRRTQSDHTPHHSPDRQYAFQNSTLSPPSNKTEVRAPPLGEYDEAASIEARYAAGRSASPQGTVVTREEINVAKSELHDLQSEVVSRLREFDREESGDSLLAHTQPAGAGHWKDELAAFEKSLDKF